MQASKDTILFVEDDRVDQIAFTRYVEKHEFPFDYILAGSVQKPPSCLVRRNLTPW